MVDFNRRSPTGLHEGWYVSPCTLQGILPEAEPISRKWQIMRPGRTHADENNQ
jgi:hypothetical protein